MAIRNKVHNVVHYSASHRNWNQYNLQQSMRYILVVAQCFAILPVNGVTKDVKRLEFKWLSVKIVYVICTMVLLTLYIVTVIIYFFFKGYENFFSLVVVAWNIRALIGLWIFLRLARKWPLLLQRWSDMEIGMIDYGPLTGLNLRFQIITLSFFITGLFEHVLFLYGAIRTTLNSVQKDDVSSEDNFLKNYFENLYVEFFGILEYDLWKAILVEFLALITTFEWQFCDLIVILLSIALAVRFQQITKEINLKHQILNEAQWRELRKRYNTLSLLCKTLNNTISEVILLSIFGNAYFLSISIFQGFTVTTRYELIYTWYGSLFNLFHFVCVCIYASWVHEESLEPLADITAVPAKNMSHEVDRLLHQMAEKDIAMYGAGLFKITRGIILNVTSAIVTLQLIFVQFNAKITIKIK